MPDPAPTPPLTPEQRAAQAFDPHRDGWPMGDMIVATATIRGMIAAAIREAVLAEREACADWLHAKAIELGVGHIGGVDLATLARTMRQMAPRHAP